MEIEHLVCVVVLLIIILICFYISNSKSLSSSKSAINNEINKMENKMNNKMENISPYVMIGALKNSDKKVAMVNVLGDKIPFKIDCFKRVYV